MLTFGQWAQAAPGPAVSQPQARWFPRWCLRWRCICPGPPHYEHMRSCTRRCLESRNKSFKIRANYTTSNLHFAIKKLIFKPVKSFLLSWLTWVAVNLILRNDDLAGVGIIGVFDGVTEDADHTDHLTCFADAVGNVAGVADELLTASHLRGAQDQRVRQVQQTINFAFGHFSNLLCVPLPQILLQPRGRLPWLFHPQVCSTCRCLHRLHSI